MPKTAMKSFVIHVTDEAGGITDVWYYPGDEVPDEHVNQTDNPDLWREETYLSEEEAQAMEWDQYSKEELKVELTNRGLPTSGSKAEQIARLVEYHGGTQDTTPAQ